MKKDLVIIHNYGSTYTAEREKEEKEQFECMMCCEGAERERASYIYCELMSGAKEIWGDNY